jgi:hypothetical protein
LALGERLIPSPIHRALSALRAHGVEHLLMGGQACVLYGAAEFSRDADIAVVADPENLDRLTATMRALDAIVNSGPPFERHYLDRGHSVHFRCGRADVRDLLVDVMSRMRGVAPFATLWARRTTLEVALDGGPALIEVMSLPDLVAAKKTQRDKDWPMIRRLVESHYWAYRDEPTPERTAFWLGQLRTPELIAECVDRFPDATRETGNRAAMLDSAANGDAAAVGAALALEEATERELDRVYWEPLRRELEQLRHDARGH